MKNKGFYKEYIDNIKDLDDPTLTKQEYDYQMVHNTGANRIFLMLRKYTIKRHWKDYKGYPLKKNFYDKNLLVCSVSIRKLALISGFSTKTTQKHLNQLEEAGWIKVAETKVKDGQKVYILGSWSNEDGKYKLFFYNQEGMIKTDKKESKFEGVYSEIDKVVR